MSGLETVPISDESTVHAPHHRLLARSRITISPWMTRQELLDELHIFESPQCMPSKSHAHVRTVRTSRLLTHMAGACSYFVGTRVLCSPQLRTNHVASPRALFALLN
jgi:hypothetical protein